MRPFALRLLAALALPLTMLCPAAARAALIGVLPGEGGIALVTVQGEFQPPDGVAFAAVVEHVSRAVVAFDSPGGATLAGIQIGNAIRAKGFATTVPDGRTCASACALAWLGGTHRLLSPQARLGFHATYTRQDGAPQVSSSGNAVVGAYMARLGYSYATIIYATAAAPTSVTWLTAAEAERLGLAVNFVQQPNSRLETLRLAALPLGAQPSPPPPVAPPPLPVAAPRPAAPPPAAAPQDWHLIPGRIFRGAYAVKGRSIPLPPGAWTEIAHTEWLGGLTGPNYRYNEVALVRAEGGPVDAFLTVLTIDREAAGAVRSWGASSICTGDRAAYDHLVQANTDTRHECGIVRPEPVTAAGHEDSQVWPKLLSLGQSQPGILPRMTLMTGFHFAGGSQAVTLRYYFGIENFGFARTADSPAAWSRTELDAAHAAVTARLAAWMGASIGTLRSATQTGRAVSLPAF